MTCCLHSVVLGSVCSFSKAIVPKIGYGPVVKVIYFGNHVIIGLCGGSASGKTTVANKIIEALDVPWVVLLSMDSFYKVLSPEEQALAASNDYNFDHPGAFDFELLVTTLRKLKQGQSVKIPVYDFTTHGRQKDWKNVYGASVIIFEGILSFADKELLQIFVDTDSYIRLVRRLRRDITKRGCDIEGQYIEPTMRLADIVVPRVEFIRRCYNYSLLSFTHRWRQHGEAYPLSLTHPHI
uniref:uridine/cytidine kinase n=1 Tax=Cyprinus carpio TaxID=7962 RepID=A0A8C1PRZ6_CYPCA